MPKETPVAETASSPETNAGAVDLLAGFDLVSGNGQTLGRGEKWATIRLVGKLHGPTDRIMADLAERLKKPFLEAARKFKRSAPFAELVALEREHAATAQALADAEAALTDAQVRLGERVRRRADSAPAEKDVTKAEAKLGTLKRKTELLSGHVAEAKEEAVRAWLAAVEAAREEMHAAAAAERDNLGTKLGQVLGEISAPLYIAKRLAHEARTPHVYRSQFTDFDHLFPDRTVG